MGAESVWDPGSAFHTCRTWSVQATSPLPMSTWNQELSDKLWPEPLGLLYTQC